MGAPSCKFIRVKKFTVPPGPLERGLSCFREYEDVLVPNLSPLPSRNRRLDLDGSSLSHGIVTEAAPWPVFRPPDQPTMDRVAVDVFQFLDALLGAPHVEVIVTGLPEEPVVCVQFLGSGLLQRLYRPGESSAFGFREKQVDVLGHPNPELAGGDCGLFHRYLRRTSEIPTPPKEGGMGHPRVSLFASIS